VDQHRDRFGVEPICEVLQIAPSGYFRHAARQINPTLQSECTKRDAQLVPLIEQVWQSNFQVYGADKVWAQLNRQGVKVVSVVLLSD
jgi:putative transposase